MSINLNTLNKQINALAIGERLSLSGVPAEMYHLSAGYGSTALKAATKSMAHFKAKLEDVDEPPSTQAQKAMILGKATHCLVLEPELYERLFAVQPEKIKRRQGPQWAKFLAENEGKEILTVKDDEQSMAMTETIRATVGKYFEGGDPEKSYWYRHPSGVIIKARLDYEVGDLIVDLKTNRADTKEKFTRAMKYDHDIQDASYRLASGLREMIFVGVGKSRPYPVFLCRQGELVRKRAEKKLEETLNMIVRAKELDDYPNIPVELIETDLTPYELEIFIGEAA